MIPSGATLKPSEIVRPARKFWPVSDFVLVCFVVTLALATAVKATQQYQHRHARSRLVKELTTAASGFRAYMRETGVMPESANSGEVPAGMAPFLASVSWTAPTPLGGFYRWIRIPVDKSKGDILAAGRIEITSFPSGPALVLSDADLLEIDQQIDDGDLSTGIFRTGFNGWPVLLVRVTP